MVWTAQAGSVGEGREASTGPVPAGPRQAEEPAPRRYRTAAWRGGARPAGRSCQLELHAGRLDARVGNDDEVGVGRVQGEPGDAVGRAPVAATAGPQSRPITPCEATTSAPAGSCAATRSRADGGGRGGAQPLDRHLRDPDGRPGDGVDGDHGGEDQREARSSAATRRPAGRWAASHPVLQLPGQPSQGEDGQRGDEQEDAEVLVGNGAQGGALTRRRSRAGRGRAGRTAE